MTYHLNKNLHSEKSDKAPLTALWNQELLDMKHHLKHHLNKNPHSEKLDHVPLMSNVSLLQTNCEQSEHVTIVIWFLKYNVLSPCVTIQYRNFDYHVHTRGFIIISSFKLCHYYFKWQKRKKFENVNWIL